MTNEHKKNFLRWILAYAGMTPKDIILKRSEESHKLLLLQNLRLLASECHLKV